MSRVKPCKEKARRSQAGWSENGAVLWFALFVAGDADFAELECIFIFKIAQRFR
jgi:hypothetical protein